MDEKLLRIRLVELMEALTSNAAAAYPRASQGTYAADGLRSSKTIDDLLDQLRLQIKYVTFDLDATRRENRYLRQMLERRSSSGEGPEQF
jgi:hypothetical protein